MMTFKPLYDKDIAKDTQELKIIGIKFWLKLNWYYTN